MYVEAVALAVWAPFQHRVSFTALGNQFITHLLNAALQTCRHFSSHADRFQQQQIESNQAARTDYFHV